MAPDQTADPAPGIDHQWLSLVTSIAAHRPSAAARGPEGRPGDPDRGAISAPVTLLTGFLGAGKSTVLARLLSEPGDTGIVRAVVNDVGRLPFDPTLVGASDHATVELTNGCGCCVAGAAAEVADRLDQVGPGADLVVLEASGLADPAALAQVVEARPRLHLDRVVTVVDARSVEVLLATAVVGPILRRQLATATVVILSHADGLAPLDLTATIDRVATLAPGRPVVPSTLHDPASRALTSDIPTGASAAGTGPGLAAGTALITRSYQPGRSVGAAELLAALDAGREGLLRVKGRVLVDGEPTLVQVNRSGVALTADRGGPVGLTVVATDHPALLALTELFGSPQAEPADGPASRG